MAPVLLILLVVVVIIILHSVARGGRGPGDDDRRSQRRADYGDDLTVDSRQDASLQGPSSKDVWLCEGRDCEALNPPRARFCRMCGRTRV